jgi:sugar lactone lactonase YvrE
MGKSENRTVKAFLTNRRSFLFSVIAGLVKTRIGPEMLSAIPQVPPGGPWVAALGVAINSPRALAYDDKGFLYIAEARGHRVFCLDLRQQKVRVVLGTGTDALDVPVGAVGVRASIRTPRALALDGKGGLWVTDDAAPAVVRMNLASGVITHSFRQDAASPSFFQPAGIVVGGNQKVYFADWSPNPKAPERAAHCLVELDPTTQRFTRILEGAGNQALSFPDGLAANGTQIYIADRVNNRILRYDAAQKAVTDVSHDWRTSETTGTRRTILDPQSLALDKGNLYFTDGLERVHRVDFKSNMIHTVAGISRATGFSGDGGPALHAKLSGTLSIALDTNDNLYISDYLVNRVRRVDARTGSITTIAGNGLPIHPKVRAID